MRIVLDFQACQSGSRYRGVGRASRSLMLGMARQFLQLRHDVICLLNCAFSDGLEDLKFDLIEALPGVQIAFFSVPTPCAAYDVNNAWRQLAARYLREHAIAFLEPDFVHIPALLPDGWGDDAVASVGALGFHVPVSLTQHDLIPLVIPDVYLPAGAFRDYYMEKIGFTKSADLLLAISEFSKKEAIQWLCIPDENVVHISSAADLMFESAMVALETRSMVCKAYGITRNFLMYAPGGFDHRKNLDRLFAAYAMLPFNVRAQFQLVVVSKLYPGQRESLISLLKSHNLSHDDVLLTDYVPDRDLICLYASCFLYLFPSLHEGFGLPALEAMLCGAPVLASDASCIPEVIGMQEALFDPYSVEDMAAKMLHALTDESFRQSLLDHSKVQPKKFSWESSATVAVDAILRKHASLVANGWKKVSREALPSCEEMLQMIANRLPDIQPSEADVDAFRKCYEKNLEASLI